ncbi:MAG TPA: hypothetical protein VHK90_17540 [Thermoanaerobaculia bacterium]|nr:hypothetical protein [Thermoanaerobaculia bacterium]
MQPIGADRARTAGDRVILLSKIPKGWTPRTPKTNTQSEHPGTTVLWEERYFEVVEATALETGGVRYVLAPWPENHTIRTFESYDAESEARRREDYDRARRQRRASLATRLAGVLLGHLPSPVQDHLQNELGVRATRMTLLSCIPPMLVVGICVYLHAGAMTRQVLSPIPPLLWPILGLLVLDSFIRFFVVMSQSRGMGSFIGTPLYILYWYLAPNRDKLVPPFGGRGESTTFMIPPPDDVALRDALEMKGPLLTLLTPAEQNDLAQRYGFDYRRHAFGITWGFLVFAVLGVVTSWISVGKGSVSALIPLIAAAAIALEQILRLIALQRGPAGSVLAIFVRPFVRDLLTARN